MKLAIITHVSHLQEKGTFFGYSAYVREMNIWSKYAAELLIAAPLISGIPGNIHLGYDHKNIRFFKTPPMAFTSIAKAIQTLFLLPVISFQLWQVMRKADHIHLRCPGTLGLLGCFIQILFPKKPKTAKYAGNWDPNAEQPFSYRLQKRLLSNTFLTRNMKVLVYGDWDNQTHNIEPFFTASYPKSKVYTPVEKTLEAPFKFVFVGTLSPGKQPEYALQMVYELQKNEIPCSLNYFGEGEKRIFLEEYIKDHGLKDSVILHGNVTAEIVLEVYKKSHFLILPSKSEGWPKVVAEAMFWGCIPMATQVSCVSWMLGHGERGLLLSNDLSQDVAAVMTLLSDSSQYGKMTVAAQKWSHNYTLDDFENAIKELLVS